MRGDGCGRRREGAGRARLGRSLPKLQMAAALFALAGSALAGDVRVTEGFNASIAPDGRRIAFQRAEDGQSHLAVMDLETGATTWLVRGKTENACHPSWGRDGTLIYSYANITNTAYERFCVKGGPQDGYGLRLWKDGVTRELTHGLWRDFAPSLAPDGKTAYLCTQHGIGTDSSYDSYSSVPVKIDALELASGARKAVILPHAGDTSVGQPVVSPDGRLIAWAELDCYGSLWHVLVARLSDPTQSAVVNDLGHSAYAPNWSADGRYLAYTGFAKGDAGWQAYVVELASGRIWRICAGENAAFAPDGKSVFVDRDGVVWRHELTEDVLTDARCVKPAAEERENVVFSLKDPKPGENLPLPAACSFSRSRTFFARARLKWNGDVSHYQRVIGIRSGGIDDAFSLYISKNGLPHVAVRAPGDMRFSLPDTMDVDVAKKPGEIVITGIRTATDIYVAVNGRRPVRKPLVEGAVSLERPETYWLGREMDPETKIESLEMGTGWPANVPRPLEGKDLLK